MWETRKTNIKGNLNILVNLNQKVFQALLPIFFKLNKKDNQVFILIFNQKTKLTSHN